MQVKEYSISSESALDTGFDVAAEVIPHHGEQGTMRVYSILLDFDSE